MEVDGLYHKKIIKDKHGLIYKYHHSLEDKDEDTN